jgi:hypothetical protein
MPFAALASATEEAPTVTTLRSLTPVLARLQKEQEQLDNQGIVGLLIAKSRAKKKVNTVV